MDESHKIPNFLKKYNFDLGSHILYEPSTIKFFTWLADNITDENVLTEDELRDYHEMEQTVSTCEQQEILYGDDLTQSIEELNKKFPNLQSYTDEDVKRWEDELEELFEIQENYEELLNDNKSLLSDIKKKNFQLDKKLSDYRELEDRLNTECLQSLREANEIHIENQKTRQEIDAMLAQSQQSPCYFHQFPLEDIFAKCRDLNSYCDQYIRKNFDVLDPNESNNSTTEHEEYTKEIEKIKSILNKSTFKVVEEEIKLMSIKAATKEFQNLNRISYDYHDMKQEMEQNNRENCEMKMRTKTLMETLKHCINELNEQKINRLILELNSHTVQRAEARYRDVKEIENASSKFMILCELVWFCVQFDSEMFYKYDIVLKEDKIEERNHLNCLKRIEKFNMLQLEDRSTSYSNEFCNDIIKRLSRSNFNQLTLKDYDELVDSIPVQMDMIVNKCRYGDIAEILDLLKENSTIVVKLLDDGPLAKPQVIDSDYLLNIYYKNCEKTKIEKELKELKLIYRSEFIDKWNNNKIWKYMNLLWIWFLTEPKKVLEAIEDLKLHESKIQSRKAVSGILCKRT